MNLAMERKLEKGEAVDVTKAGERIAPGVWRLREFVDNVDYCDAEREEWIWSIGRNLATGDIVAATDTRFYLNDEWECLWLR